ncbi:MAG: hypothetical protein OER86_12155, partial [Phycisphaerae bacterium]|nr:hypothetical protein [Phycisphaerae bacterium]
MNVRTLSLALVVLLGSVSVAGAQDAALRQENASLRAQVANLQAQVDALQSRLAAVQADKQQLTTQKTQLESQQQALAREKAELARQKQSIEQRAQEFFLVRSQDPQTGRTTVSSKLMPMTVVVGPPRFHWLSFNYGFEGSQPPQPPGPVEIEFQSFFTGVKYKKVD